MHIVIVNAHWNNRGDEAAHRALWEELCRRYPKCQLTVIFKDRQPITGFPADIPASYFSCQFTATLWDIWLTTLSKGRFGLDPQLKKTVRTLAAADLIVHSPGGSVISDRFFWSKQLEYLVPFLYARLYCIPMVLAAPSIGPFDSQPYRRLRNWLLKTPKVLCVREPISQQYLASIGIRKNVHVTMDLAFMNNVDEYSNQMRFDEYPELRDFLGTHRRVVGITISDFKWHVKLGQDRGLPVRIEDVFRKMISALVTKGYGVLLIPQLFGNQHDYDLLKTFAANENTFVMSEVPDAYFQQFVISKLHALIGMRYHSNIFAAKAGTPFVAIVYEEKMAGFLEVAGLTSCAISLGDLSFEKLWEKFSALEDNYKDLRLVLSNGSRIWRAKAYGTMDLIAIASPSENDKGWVLGRK